MKLRMLISFAALYAVAGSGICQANDAEWNRRIETAPFREQTDRLYASFSPHASAQRSLYIPAGPILFVGEDEKSVEQPRSITIPSETASQEKAGTDRHVVRLSETKTSEGNVKPYSAA